MAAALRRIGDWWRGLAPAARKVITVAGSIFLIWLVLSLVIASLAGSPKSSTAGKRFERCLAAEEIQVTRAGFSKPSGLALYLKHGGRVLKVEDHASIGLWWGSRISTIGLVLLLGSLPFWGAMRGRGISGAGSERSPPLGRSGITALCVVMGLAAVLRAQRLEGPLLRDEQDTLKRNVWGILVEDADGSLKFQKAEWTDAFFENGGANNPILFSISAKLSLAAWRAVTGASDDRFSLAALRLPSLIAGVLAVGAVALLGARLGFPLAGLCAALLLAIHPWHIRYSVEARGYSLAIFFALAGWILLASALRSGRWGTWIGFAAAQMLLIYSYTGAIYVAAAQSLLALGFLIHTGRSADLPKMLVPIMASALLYVQLVLPCAPQILNYLSKETTFGVMDAGWGAETLGAFAAGVNLGIYQGEPPPEFQPVWDLRDLPAQRPLLALVILIVCIGLVIGIARLFKAGAIPRLIASALIASPLLAFAHNKFTGHYLYPWYLIFALPPLLLFVALALTWPGEAVALRSSSAGRLAATLLPPLILAALIIVAVPPAWYRPAQNAAGPHELWRGNKRIVIYPEGFVVQKAPPKE